MRFIPAFLVQPRSPNALYPIVAAMLAVIAWLDYATGYELSFVLFYFLPISMTAWHRGPREGSLIAIFATTGWYFSNLLSGQQHSTPFITMWNTAMRLGAFLILALIVARVGREMKKLQNLLPICGWCKKIRNDSGYWEQVEDYFRNRDQTRFSHGACPECSERFYQPKTLLVGSKPEEVLDLKDALVKANLPHILYDAPDFELAQEWLAGNGRCADQKKHPSPDILLLNTDATQDCFAFLRWLQEQKRFKDMPVLCLSSSENPTTVKQAYDAGATSIFAKAGYEDLTDFLKTSRAY